MSEKIKFMTGLSRTLVFLFLLTGFVLVLLGTNVYVSLIGNLFYFFAGFFALIPFGFKKNQFKINWIFWTILIFSIFFIANYRIGYLDFVRTKFEQPPFVFFIYRSIICIMLFFGFCFRSPKPIDKK